MVMSQPDFDVIVAGAGASGAANAYYLTQAGLKVLVVDKARLPRYKACGGAIPRVALDRFPFDFDDVIQGVPSDVRLTFSGFPAVDAPLPDQPVVMVMRSKFDAFLLSHSSAEVLDGMTVTGVSESDDRVHVEVESLCPASPTRRGGRRWDCSKRGKRRFAARYLVGADGATSTVARSLGLRPGRRLGGTLEAQVPLNGNCTLQEEYGSRAVFSLAVVPWGYAWVFPKGDCLSVGIGRFRPGRVDLHTSLQCEVARLGIDLKGVELHGHPLPGYQAPPWPFWRGQPQERLSTRRCLLVGDAAGLVDPLLGEGIRYAIHSARLAAEFIADDDLSGYEAAIWQEIGHSLATAELTANTYYRFPRQCYQLGLQNPAVLRQLTDLLAGRFSYEGIGRRLLAITARWLIGGRKTEGWT